MFDYFMYYYAAEVYKERIREKPYYDRMPATLSKGETILLWIFLGLGPCLLFLSRFGIVGMLQEAFRSLFGDR